MTALDAFAQKRLVRRMVDAFGAPELYPLGVVGDGVTAVEKGISRCRRTTILTVDTTLPAIAGGAALGIGKLIYTLPAGRILINSCAMSLAITASEENITEDTPDIGVGTTLVSGAVSVIGGTATNENLIDGSAAADCNGTPTVGGGIPKANVPLLRAAADAHTIYVNVADTWAASGDAAALLQGIVVVNWDWFF